MTEHGLIELRLSVPEAGKRLPVPPGRGLARDVGKRVLKPIGKGDDVLVYGQLAAQDLVLGGDTLPSRRCRGLFRGCQPGSTWMVA
jgi:hypothetical protein